MFAKVVLFSCVAVAAMAGPDRRPSYQPPQQQSYQPPQQQSYQPPQQQSYQPPQQQSYQPPQEPRPSYSQRQQTYQEPENEEGMPFEYSYAVQDQYSGNDFAHDTNSDGDVTTGEYRVLLPDGRTQIVTYKADNYNGYQAEVTYEGEARPYEPQPQASYQQPRQQAPQNSYQAPQNSYEPPQNSYQAPQQQPRQGYGF